MMCCVGTPSCTLRATARVTRENVILPLCDHCITELIAAGKLSPTEHKPLTRKYAITNVSPPRGGLVG